MDLLSSASLSESVTSTRAVFRRLKRALFGGAFLFPTGSRSPCCSTRSIPIGGITKEKQLHFLDLTERLFGLKSETSPLPIKCRPRTNEGTKGSKATAAKRTPEERSEAARKAVIGSLGEVSLAREISVPPQLVTDWFAKRKTPTWEQGLRIQSFLDQHREDQNV